MKFQKLNLNYLTLIISYFFLLKLNTSLFISESLSINFFFLNFFKGFKLFNLIEISIILIPVIFIRNKKFNSGILFSYTLYLLLFVPFLVLFFDPNSKIIVVFFQHLELIKLHLNSDYISIEKNKFYLFIFILTINFCILLFFTSNNKKINIIKKIFIFDKGNIL